MNTQSTTKTGGTTKLKKYVKNVAMLVFGIAVAYVLVTVFT